MTNPQVEQSFLQHCKASGLSDRRTKKYQGHINQIKTLIKKDYQKLTQKDLENILINIYNRGYKNSTIRDYQIFLKKFFKWLGRPKIIGWIKPKKVQYIITEQDVLTEHEINQMLESADNPRNKALIFFLFKSGTRPEEAQNTRIKDIVLTHITGPQGDQHQGWNLNITKSKTLLRVVPVIDEAGILKAWIDIHPFKHNQDSYLWIRLDHFACKKPLSNNAMLNILKRIGKTAGIKKKVLTKTFRKSYVTSMLRRGIPERVIKKLVGHSPHSTSLDNYALIVDSDLNQASIKLNQPLDQPSNKTPMIIQQLVQELVKLNEFKTQKALPNPEQSPTQFPNTPKE